MFPLQSAFADSFSSGDAYFGCNLFLAGGAYCGGDTFSKGENY